MFPKPTRKQDPELLERVRKQPCSVCGAPGPGDPSHVKSRGTLGPDEPWNVLPMCRGCHQRWHQMGVRTFLSKYPIFLLRLESLGWDFSEGKLFHPELADAFHRR